MPAQASIASPKEGEFPRLRPPHSADVPLARLLSTPLQLPPALEQFFDQKLDPGRAASTIRTALTNREQRFLHLVQTQVFEHGNSPYLKLFKHAGCEMQDLQDLVSSEGLEAALGRLVAEGVFLSNEEFKGKRPVVRRRRFSSRTSRRDAHWRPRSRRRMYVG